MGKSQATVIDSSADAEDPLIPSLRALQKEFVGILPERLENLTALRNQVAEGGLQQGVLHRIHMLVHNLRGEAMCFGFGKLAAKAADAEEILARPAARFNGVSLLNTLVILAESMEYFLGDVRLPDLPAEALGETRPDGSAQKERLLFLVDDDPEMRDLISLQLQQYGFSVAAFPGLKELTLALQEEHPAALVMDIILPEGKLAGAEYVAAMKHRMEKEIPVVFISTRSDIEARLHTCRAGGVGFFTKPLDFGLLTECLDELTGRIPRKPYEVLIVDDDELIAQHYAAVLRRAGLSVSVVTNPLLVLDSLAGSRPDLILLDLYMPECDGQELAAILRQHESFLSIPIVFLSSEDDLDQKLKALDFGGDEFLTKPIEPDHLVAAVLPRAQRGRQLGSRMHRDGLTGLMTHSHQKERLEIELLRAERDDSSVVFAMLDVDHFKKINDTYGHGSGDRVLCSLAGLLRKRLRRTDLIARYGGDEFAVVLPSTEPETARSIFEGIGESFSRLVHFSGEEQFSVTLSCGLAGSPPLGDPQHLTESADRALYEAKHLGRDQVVVAGPS